MLGGAPQGHEVSSENKFSCLVVPLRGMKGSPVNSEFSSASLSVSDIALPNTQKALE
jgi:hypothetical protein